MGNRSTIVKIGCIGVNTEGATFNIFPRGYRGASKQVQIDTHTAGRIALFPFNSSSSTFDAIAASIDDEEDDYTTPPAEVIEYEKSTLLKERSAVMITHADEALRYDTGLTDTQKANITGYINQIYALKRDTTKTYEVMLNELTGIYRGLLANDVGFSYSWQTLTRDFPAF